MFNTCSNQRVGVTKAWYVMRLVCTCTVQYMYLTVHYVTELYVYISVQALVDLCCVTVTKFVGTTNDFRLPTDIRQTLQRYVFSNNYSI